MTTRTLEPCLHYIDGQFCASRSGEFFETTSPATEQTLARVARGQSEDIDDAVRAAKAAAERKDWAGLSPQDRAEILFAIAGKIHSQRHELARLESLDTGKPYRETYNGDIVRAAANFEFFADLLVHQKERRYTSNDGSVHIAQRTPIGVVGLITPWNLPLYLATWKIAPALAMGNTIVLKPAELTPLSAAALAKITSECGLPRGVFNIVQGFGAGEAGEALVGHPDVKAISFTGETTTGTHIMSKASAHLKKLSFELGGKGASVVFADADIEDAAKTACFAAFRNQGQICLAGSRLIVEESVAEQVIDRVLQHMDTIEIGDPLKEETTMGALISDDHRKKVAGYVDIGRREGCKILRGGRIPPRMTKGAYYEPTLVTNVSQSSQLIQQEVFGPVLTVQTFRDKHEALELLNGTQYGLSCSIYSRNKETIQFMSQGARHGLVWINSWFLRNLNTPFGGMKRSGIGREGGELSLDFYSEAKTTSYPEGSLTWI